MLSHLSPPSLVYRMQIHKLQCEAIFEISKHIDPDPAGSAVDALSASIRSFDERILAVSMPAERNKTSTCRP